MRGVKPGLVHSQHRDQIAKPFIVCRVCLNVAFVDAKGDFTLQLGQVGLELVTEMAARFGVDRNLHQRFCPPTAALLRKPIYAGTSGSTQGLRKLISPAIRASGAPATRLMPMMSPSTADPPVTAASRAKTHSFKNAKRVVSSANVSDHSK